MQFYPAYNSETQRRYDWWTQNVATNIVCRWHSQGGIEYSVIKNQAMQDDLDSVLNEIGDELSEIHSKGFKAISKAREEKRKNV